VVLLAFSSPFASQPPVSTLALSPALYSPSRAPTRHPASPDHRCVLSSHPPSFPPHSRRFPVVPSAAPSPRRFLAPLSAFQPLDEPASAFLRGRSAHPRSYIVVVRCLPPAAGTVLPHFRLPTLNLAPRRTNKPPRRWRQRCTDRRSLSNGENASYEPTAFCTLSFSLSLSFLPHFFSSSIFHPFFPSLS